MANPVVIGDIDTPSGRLLLWCPGCDELQQVSSKWEWDGNRDAPTITGSILVMGGRQGPDHRCHSFVRNGQWEFLTDSTHALAGQTVPMVPLPDYLVSNEQGL